CLVKSLDLCQRLTGDGERFRRSKLLALASPTKFNRSFRCLTYWARIRIARRGLFLFLRITLLTNSIAGAHLRLCDRFWMPALFTPTGGQPGCENRRRTKPRQGSAPIRECYQALACTGSAARVLQDRWWCQLLGRDGAATARIHESADF